MEAVDRRASEGSSASAAFVVAVAVVLVMAAVPPIVLLWPDSDGYGSERFDRWAAVALTVVVAYPAIVALATRRRCSRLLLGCGLSCLPRMFLSFSFLFFPLIVPAIIFMAIAKRDCSHRSARHLLVNIAIVVLGLWSIAALLITRDPVSYEYPGGSGYTSDVVTAEEAILSVALSGLGVLIAAAAALPPHRHDSQVLTRSSSARSRPV